VILKGYREWGERVVDHLFGMFAFAVTELDTDAWCWPGTGSA